LTNYYYTVIFSLLVLIWILFFFSIRIWIPFAAEMLRAVANIITLYPSTWLVSFLTVLVQIGWTLFWCYTVLLVQHRFTDIAIKGLSAYLVLSFFWTYQTIRNVLHTTNSGVRHFTAPLDDRKQTNRLDSWWLLGISFTGK